MDRAALGLAAAAHGLRLVPEHKLREPMAQLAVALDRQGIDAVLDVGANVGQYGSALRAAGWSGPIMSFEPLPAAHAELTARVACDSAWTVAAPLALAERSGTARIGVSAESDMSSLLPQTPLLQRLSPTSAVVGEHEVRIERLDSVEAVVASGWRRMFLKLDVQGAESLVLTGVGALWPRVHGLQLELPVVPLYHGEQPWRQTLDQACAQGFAPWLFIPGYFERHLARQLQVDVVLFREPDNAVDCDPGMSPPT